MKTFKLSLMAPYLAAVLALTQLPAFAAQSSPDGERAPAEAENALCFRTVRRSRGGCALADARSVLDIVNALREENGAPPLRLDGALCRAAQLKADEMSQKGYFSHISPTYGSPGQMLSLLGISWNCVGENIARGYESASSVMSGWTGERGHIENMLRPVFSELGVGYSPRRGIWVQVFKG